ncbi:MAG: SAM-dependent methyltransferase [Rhodopirellula sp.]|nr:SAM-dependent methyltransferase [Rhodopirellula sp.]|tara:strand:+ start:21525 stop:22754 length:1230 start_codon:yes stop_codon:yes gene_type:complete
MECRHCGHNLVHSFADLGSAPPSNSYLSEERLNDAETWYRLNVLVCDKCWLVQTDDYVASEEMFSDDYAYYSSFSSSWVNHAKNYVDLIVQKLGLNENSNVVEIAANDGYLLQFVKGKNIPCYGIEPTTGTANEAKKRGIEIVENFFTEKLAYELVANEKSADLIIANNVLAHVPDINDFLKAFKALLKPNGTATFEFPYLVNLVDNIQFDTIYHEHFSYLSLTSLTIIFKNNGLHIYDIEYLSTHGGSLRVYAKNQKYSKSNNESLLLRTAKENETNLGLNDLNYYFGFIKKIEKVKNNLLKFLINAKENKEKVIGYGAAAKGNTLINYSGIKSDLIKFIVDKNPNKQNKFMPGSKIPILHPSSITEYKPDYILILPWNLSDEIINEVKSEYYSEAKFITAIPELIIK